jgi:hypothetical protein
MFFFSTRILTKCRKLKLIDISFCDQLDELQVIFLLLKETAFEFLNLNVCVFFFIIVYR